MLDRYIRGRTERISPEAPVPVVRIESEEERLGGAANVIHNVHALGGTVVPLGIIGRDRAGERILDILKGNSILTDGILSLTSRETTQKIRIISHSQQMIRLDREKSGDLTGEEEAELVKRLDGLQTDFHAVIIEDYGKGVVTSGLVRKILERCRSGASRVPVIVDPSATRMERYRGVDFLTPNHHEAARATGREVGSDDELREVVRILETQIEPEGILVTRGEQGMSLFLRGREPVHIPTRAREVFDVSGAGDTVVATMALALGGGATPLEAAEVANHAAGIVVGKFGTATVRPEELKANFDHQPD
jgi:D-beta-D-heptose 7-phosphate kinase/D-beta-D-heptose 1-phosphate adenosyltransferase